MSVLTYDLSHTQGQQAASTDSSTPCRSNDPELWFAERPAEVARAQALCGGCALRAACLTGALERREPWGVWGGELFERGSVVARKRRPGRPRKDDHLDRHAAEAALAERLSELTRELATAPAGDLDDESGYAGDATMADVCAISAQRGGAAA